MKPYSFIKQALDYIFAAIFTILLSPLLLVIAIAIKLDSPGPVLFKQRRVGKDRKEFDIYKFRTMKSDAPKDQPTHLLSDPYRYITKTGRFLRKSSLDELPQLFNIFKGEMSFIGPRPALWNQYDLIQARENQESKVGISANSCHPGISGWAQVNGRDELPIDVKAGYDGYYTQKMSFILDFKILFMTIKSVLWSKGVLEGGSKSTELKEGENK